LSVCLSSPDLFIGKRVAKACREPFGEAERSTNIKKEVKE